MWASAMSSSNWQIFYDYNGIFLYETDSSGKSLGTSVPSVISCFQLVLFFHLSGLFTWVLLDRCVYVSAAECVVLPATATFKGTERQKYSFTAPLKGSLTCPSKTISCSAEALCSVYRLLKYLAFLSWRWLRIKDLLLEVHSYFESWKAIKGKPAHQHFSK